MTRRNPPKPRKSPSNVAAPSGRAAPRTPAVSAVGRRPARQSERDASTGGGRTGTGDTRTRILDVAAALFAEAGPAHIDQVTTRAVCDAAGVGAPTLYHHFGDKDGLVAAVVARTAANILAVKGAIRLSSDPIADVRRGWDVWVAFALSHPALFALLVANSRAAPDATAEAYARLSSLLARVEVAGRLSVPLSHATDVVWAAAQGVTALIVQRAYADKPLDDVRRISATLRDAVLAAVAPS